MPSTYQEYQERIAELRQSSPDLFLIPGLEEEEKEEELLQQMQDSTQAMPLPEEVEEVEEVVTSEEQVRKEAEEYFNSWGTREGTQTQQEEGLQVIGEQGVPVDLENLEEYSLNDIENPEHFLYDEWQERGQRFIEGLTELDQASGLRKSGDIFEYLRDEHWSTTRTIMRAMENRKWTPQMTEDYKFLRQVFDKAKLGGTNQIWEATKDIGIDLIVDPMNLVTAAVSVFTAGLGGAALQAGGRTLLTSQLATRMAGAQAVKSATERLGVIAKGRVMQGASIGMTEGALDASLMNTATQFSELQTGIRQDGDEFSIGELGAASGLGTLFGLTLGGGIVKVGSALSRRGYTKAVGEKDFAIPEKITDSDGTLRDTTEGDIKNMRRVSESWNKFISVTFGKATTAFKTATQDSPIMAKVISLFRGDALRDIIDVKGALSGRAELSAPLEIGFNPGAERITGQLRAEAEKWLARAKNTGQGWAGKYSFWRIRLDPTVNKQLRTLVTITQRVDDPIVDDAGKILNIDELYVKYYNEAGELREGAAEAAQKGSKLWEEVIAPETIGAAFHMRKAFDAAHTAGSRIRVLNPYDVEEFTSLFSLGSQYIEGYFPRIWKYAALTNVEVQNTLSKLLFNTTHSDPMNEFKPLLGRLNSPEEAGETLKINLNNKTRRLESIDEDGVATEIDADTLNNIKFWSIEEEGTWTNKIDKQLEFILKDQGTIDEEAFGQNFLKVARRNLGAEASNEEVWKAAKRLKSKALVDQMVNRKYNLVGEHREIGPERTGFTRHRAFSELSDDDLLDLGLIEENVEEVFRDYMYKIGKSIQRTSLFGNGKLDFANRWLEPIKKELQDAGWTDARITKLLGKSTGESTGLMKLFTYTTGLESDGVVGFSRHILDGAKLSMRMALLPFATISSLTEPMIALSRADLPDTPAYIKAFANAGGLAFKKMGQRLYRRLSVATGRDVKGFKDLTDEEWIDFNESGLALQQAMENRLQGLYGETYTGWARSVSNKFFQLNLLVPWTEAVQMGAYNFANARTTRILGDLNRDANFMGQKLSRRARNRRIDELRELNIEPVEAVAAYRKHINKETGTFDMSSWRESEFFDNTIIPGSSVFARQIILNPAVAEANTPLWFKGVAGSLFAQFAGYPTAFNNIVLKGMLRGALRHPLVNGSKVVATTTLMTGTALLANMLRSYGASLEEEPRLQVAEAVRRWGGMGPGEYPWRHMQSVRYGATGVAPAIKAVAGPLPGKVLDWLMYHQTIPEALISFMPGWAALSREQRAGIRRWIRSKRPSTKRMSTRAGAFAKGGIVDIDNAVDEPDERIDRMTGLPYNLQAGEAFQDEEDRVHFIVGGLASALARTLFRAGNKRGLRTRERYLDEDYLDTLGGKAAEPFRQEVSLVAIKGLLEDGQITTKEAGKYLKAAKYRRHTIRKFLRPYKEVGINKNLTAKDIDFEDIEGYEDRTGFAEGSEVEVEENVRELTEKEKARLKVQENPVYRFLTRDEEEYATLDATPLSIYENEDDLPELDIKETFYTSLPEDTRKAKLDAYRDSSTLGLKVSNSPVKGNVKLSGKIKFSNLLTLNIDEVTPSTVEEQLSVVRSGNVLAESYLADSIIRGIKYQLGVRDSVLEIDKDASQDAKDLVEQSKSFILRHGLMKLGYDAIKYNNGYVLLRENQFMPTKIVDTSKRSLATQLSNRRARKMAKQGGLSNTLKRRRASYQEGGDLEFDEGDDVLLNKLRENAYSRLKIKDRERAERELQIINDAIVMAESSNDFTAQNPDSTASGGYQFIDEAAKTAANRTINTLNRMEGDQVIPAWLESIRDGNLNVRDVSPRRQQILFEGDMFEREGSDPVVGNILRGKRKAMNTYYYDFHHGDPESQPGTIENWERALELIDK